MAEKVLIIVCIIAMVLWLPLHIAMLVLVYEHWGGWPFAGAVIVSCLATTGFLLALDTDRRQK